jgi:uncharacterized delta-60 repeat protein
MNSLPCSIILVFSLFAQLPFSGYSQAIKIDSSFNGNGIVMTTPESIAGRSLAVQEDGKLLIAGYNPGSFFLSRYNANGTADAGFGNSGVATKLFSGTINIMYLKVYPDGKILALVSDFQTTHCSLFRFYPNGRQDMSFGTGGEAACDWTLQAFSIRDMQIQADGKILVYGGGSSTGAWAGFLITRLNEDGSRDAGFGDSGETITYFTSVESDTTFPKIYTGGASIGEVVLQDDGKIIACGSTGIAMNGTLINDSVAITRYNTNGTLDSSFNMDGKMTLAFDPSDLYVGTVANSISLQADGKLVVGALWFRYQSHAPPMGDFVVFRVAANGTIDSSFSDDGMQIFAGQHNTQGMKSFIQADGRIILAGNSITGLAYENSEIILGRALADGNLDSSFGPTAQWWPHFQTTSGTQSLCGGYSTVMHGQKIYMLGYRPWQTDDAIAGIAIFAFEVDGELLHPHTLSLCASSAGTTIRAGLSGPGYQWQLSTDSVHFETIIDDSHFAGVNSSSLVLSNVPSGWDGYRFRCVNGAVTGNTTTIHVLNENEFEWTGNNSNAWEDPANWLCGTLPGAGANVVIRQGNVSIHSNVIIKDIQLQPGTSLTVETGHSLSLQPGTEF